MREINSNLEIDLPNTIDLSLIYRIIIRKKKLVVTLTALSFFLSVIYALNQKYIWKGQFQIVISNNNNTNNLSIPNSLSGLRELGLKTSLDKGKKTELEILKSPSVLMPVYEFVKNKKSFKKNYGFVSWREDNFKAKILTDTKILEVAYFDKDKDFILPVLNKISEEYKKYSKKDLITDNERENKYLQEQINQYKLKALNSNKAAEEFAKLNNLTPFIPERKQVSEFSRIGKDSQPNSENYFFASVEGLERAYTKKRINSLTQLLDTLNSQETKNINSTVLKDIASSIFPNLEFDPYFKQLNNVENQLAKAKAIFLEKDSTIKNLRIQSNELISSIKNRLTKSIKTQLEISKKRYDLTERPNNVYSTYRELFRENIRNEATLVFLENQKVNSLLKSKIKTKPWELITNPTLFNVPSAPNKSRLVMVGTFLGFILSIIIILLSDKKRELVYKINEVENILGIKSTFEVSNENEAELKLFSELLQYGTLENLESNSLSIIPIGTIPLKNFEIIKRNLKKLTPNRKMKIPCSIVESRNYKINILVVRLGECTKNNLNQFKNSYKMQNCKSDGFLIIKD